MSKLFLILFIFCFCLTNSQTKIVDNKFEITYKKSHKNSRNFEVHASNSYIKAPKGYKKIQIRFKVKSTSNKKVFFDPNKFYLISEKYKKRVRPVNINHSHFLHTFKGFSRRVHNKPEKKKLQYLYEPEIKDTFRDYKKEGYEDIEDEIDFGVNKETDYKKFYYKPEKIKSKVIDIYFIVSSGFKDGIIYYGHKKLIEFSVK